MATCGWPEASARTLATASILVRFGSGSPWLMCQIGWDSEERSTKTAVSRCASSLIHHPVDIEWQHVEFAATPGTHPVTYCNQSKGFPLPDRPNRARGQPANHGHRAYQLGRSRIDYPAPLTFRFAQPT